MAFTGNEDHSILPETASEWTKNFRESIAPDDPDQTIGHYFSKSYLQQILSQDNCVGMRIYHALDGSSMKQLVIVGVLANQDDIVTGIIGENALKSPPNISTPNSLNS